MSAHVRIRRLNLRVLARSAPWATREELARVGERARSELLAGLERMLADALSGLADGAHLGTIDVEVPAAPRRAHGALSIAHTLLDARLDAALGCGVKRSVQRQRDERAVRTLPEPGGLCTEKELQQPRESARVHAGAAQALLALLLAWHDEGRLAARLALLSPELVRGWLQTCSEFTTAGAAAELRSNAAADLTFDEKAAARALPYHELAPHTAADQLLTLVTQLADDTSPPRSPTELSARAAGAVAGERDAAKTSPAQGSSAHHGEPARVPSTRSPASLTLAPRARHKRPPPVPTLVIERERARLPARAALETVLPFLLLGPLSRSAWLDTAIALLAVRSAAPHAHALGFALALKGLPATGPLSAELLRVAAYAAGVPEPVAPRALLNAERALGPQLAALDVTLSDALARGHDPQRPLFVWQTALGLALIDPEGLFPLAIGTPSELALVARAVGVPLRVDAHAQSRALELEGTGLAYERCPMDGERLLRALGSPRTVSAEASVPALERSATLAAALALGEIAWRLCARAPFAWADPDPCLALERFGDLAGTMIVASREVTVRLPLGPRARDLEAAGLLADVDEVPWLGGRRLCFGIG
jgi:hypothetical protein